MRKVVAFVGSARRRHTYGAVREFLDRLEALGGVATEMVMLSDYRIDTCRGCRNCFERGEEFCPFKDDRDVLIDKMMTSDGAIFASPNYSFQVSGFMKVFLDRLGYVFHRPRFHGKIATSIVTQGIYGGQKLVKYLDFAAFGLGFTVVKGSCSTGFEPMTEKELAKRDRTLAAQAIRFHKQLCKSADRVPGLIELALFRYARATIMVELDDTEQDYRYYLGKGWFTSDYYYRTRLGAAKKALGKICDFYFTRVATARASARPRRTSPSGPAQQPGSRTRDDSQGAD